MSASMFSPSWYKVATLQPRLRGHAEIHRHHYRGQLWYVLQDRLTARNHRLSSAAYFLIGLMDGGKTVQQVWEIGLEQLGDDAPSQDEVIRLLGQLHASDLLLCDVPPNTHELFLRQARHRKLRWKQYLLSPFSLRFPLWDPDAFLVRWEPWVRRCFTAWGFWIWLAVVGAGLAGGLSHWTELTQDVADQVLAPDNLVILLFVYPLVKLLHELGHGFATRVWGGEVHELGVMFLVFMPVPYVDASSSAAFRDRRRRMVVGAGGMLVEMFLAAIAVFVWLNVEPGVVRAIAYNVIFIGSVSTLIFNANPLLRFDGYFILADAIEVPNLAGKATQYLSFLFQRHVLGSKQAASPAHSAGEARWLLVYGIGSFGYRLFVAVGIILFVAEKFFFFGVLLAIWGAVSMLLLPVWKGIRFLLANQAGRQGRGNATTAITAIAASLAILLFLLPLPLYTRCEGVVWLPENAEVRAEADGFVRTLARTPEQAVEEGEPLVEMEDSLLRTRRDVLAFRVAELEAKYHAEWHKDLIKAQITQEELEAVRADLVKAQEDFDKLVLKSPASGTLIVPHAEDILQKRFKQGDLIGFVVQRPVTTVRVVVTQDDIGLVREGVREIELRVAERVDRVYRAVVRRAVPAASDKLPSMALSTAGGGEIALDPTDREGKKVYEAVFQYDLDVPGGVDFRNIGSRVYVRFDHGYEPLAFQVHRKLRQLFLRKYGV